MALTAVSSPAIQQTDSCTCTQPAANVWHVALAAHGGTGMCASQVALIYDIYGIIANNIYDP